MTAVHRSLRCHAHLLVALVIGSLVTPLASAGVATAQPVGDMTTSATAWRNGRFEVDRSGVVSRSDLVFAQPNFTAHESVPLGNGTLGAAVWADQGFTAQLNRNDTMPDRKSPGQLVIPGLGRLAAGADYQARLRPYDATFVQSGNGMTATTFVRADADQLVVEVTGADPGVVQTAQLNLWSPRQPRAAASGSVAMLSETWTDERGLGATHATFGTLAAFTAAGREATADVVDPVTVRLRFKPRPDGSFRIVVAAPQYAGGDASAQATPALGDAASRASERLRAPHQQWWRGFWDSVGLIRADSADGVAQYAESLRTLNLYTTAASSRSRLPGSQAGVADLFSYHRDYFFWDASAYWHWNLRMQTAANMGAGAFALNDPYFRLYRDNLPAIQRWTREQMGNREGICVPETMRFSGQGYENETWLAKPGLNCHAGSEPYYNARTISTGAEVGLNVWRQYQATRDEGFLKANYPLMAEAARFLLAYATVGPDGRLQTFPSNAHETHWDVRNPTSDLAAMKAQFPAVIAAARHLHTDADLIDRLTAALPKIPGFKTTGDPGKDVIAPSFDPDAPKFNVENVGLEPVWPFDLIDDAGPDSALAVRTFLNRPYKLANDWSYDPVHAARLGQREQIPALLTELVRKFQTHPSGMADVSGRNGEQQPYGEMMGIVALTLNEALVQDVNDAAGPLVRVAPAWPSGWDVAGTVFVRGKHKIDVQVHGGTPTTVGIEAGSDQTLRLRNPWPGRAVHVRDASGTDVVGPTDAAVITVPVVAGQGYLVEPVDAARQQFAPVGGQPAQTVKSLAGRTLGLGTYDTRIRGDLAEHRLATQSSTLKHALNPTADKAVDGNTDGDLGRGSLTHTTPEAQPWWQVDLLESKQLNTIEVHNRTDCCADRLSDYHVLVSDNPFGNASLEELLRRPDVWSSHQTTQAANPTKIAVGRAGRYVRVQLARTDVLSLAEVVVTGAPVPPAPRSVTYDGHSFIVDGKPIFLWSGEFHYFRLPSPDLWRDVLQKMKASGFNAVSLYFSWGYHSPAPGVYDFTGVRDIDRLLTIAEEAGVYVVARPGPYINAEVDAGGLPGWMTTQAGHSRSSAPDYLAAAKDWLRRVNAIIARHQLDTGNGSVILYQVENEYCFAGTSRGLDAAYMEELQQQARRDGIRVPLFHNSCYNRGAPWSSGRGAVQVSAWDAYPNGFSCDNPASWGNIPDYTDARALTPPNEPLYMAEFQGGSFDPWGGLGYDKCREKNNGPFSTLIGETAIAAGFTGLNYYMEYGGTNWGWQADTLTSGYTSYDYGAAISESRGLTSKYAAMKPLGYFTQSTRSLARTYPLPAPASTNPAIRVAARQNPDDKTQFVLVQHKDRRATSTDSTTFALTTADGSYQVPVSVAGRDSSMLVAGANLGGQRLVYSTSELMTTLDQGGSDLAVLYGRHGQAGQTVLRYADQPVVTVLDGAATSSWDPARGDLELTYSHDGLTRVRISGGGRPDLLLLIGDDAAVERHWVTSGVLSAGPYLVRTAARHGAVLDLTGDTSQAGPLEVYAPAGVTTLRWNGGPLTTHRTAAGTLIADLAGPRPVALPSLNKWKHAAGTPEADPAFDDARWTYATRTTTNNPTRPGTLPVLYADDYNFHSGHLWYRGHFTAAGTETSIALTTATGPAGQFSVWLNGTFLGSRGEGNHRFDVPAGTLRKGQDNVVSVLVENMGHTEQSVFDNDAHKQPRGLTAAALTGSPASLTWKIQGARGGESPIDPVRGPYNNGGLTGERDGWSLPGFPDRDWSEVTTPHSNTKPGVSWYRMSVTLDLPKDQDVSMGLTITDPPTRASRALIFVNGWQFGRHISDVGPQHTFPIPNGILRPNGENTIAIAVWNADASTGGLGEVSLTVLGNVSSSLRVSDVASPGYDAGRYAHPPVPARITATAPDELKASGTGTVTATLTVPADGSTLRDVALGLRLPAGWSATPKGPTTFAEVRPGAHVTTAWGITAPADQPPGVAIAAVTGSYLLDRRPGSVNADRVIQIRQPPLPPGEHVVSDLPFQSETNGWGPVERNMSNGESAAGDGKPITLHGITYAKGLGAHADSTVAVWTGGTCTRLTAKIGIDQEVYGAPPAPGHATVTFTILADGRPVYTSPTVGREAPTLDIAADVTGAHVVELVVGDASDGNGHDHADWADLKLTCG